MSVFALNGNARPLPSVVMKKIAHERPISTDLTRIRRFAEPRPRQGAGRRARWTARQTASFV